MAQIYFDATAASNGSGTEASPYNVLQDAIAALTTAAATADSTLWVAGTERGTIKYDATAYRTTIKQWPHKQQFVLRGDFVPTWVKSASGVFYADISFDQIALDDALLDSADYIASVMLDWDAKVDLLGRHYGHLTRAAGATLADQYAAVVADSNTFFYDYDGSQTGTAHRIVIGVDHTVYTTDTGGGSTDINVLNVACAVGTINGIEIGTPTFTTPWGATSYGLYAGIETKVTIDGIHVYLFPDSGNISATRAALRSIGYGIRIADGVNCVLKNIKTIDTGYHGLGYVGNLCHDNIFEHCECWGGNPSTSGFSSFVFYTGSAGAGDHNIYNCIGRRCVAQIYNLLGPDGNPITNTASCDGFLSHTDNNTGTVDGNVVQDVEWRDCYAVFSGKLSDNTGCAGNGFYSNSCANPTGTSGPANKNNPFDYPVRVIGGGIVNGNKNYTANYCSIAFHKCSLKFPRMGALSTSTNGFLGSTTGTNLVLFSGCEIVANLDAPGSWDCCLFYCSATNDIRALNCSIYIVGSPSNARFKSMVYLSNSSAARLTLKSNILGFQQAKQVVTGSGNKLIIYTGMATDAGLTNGVATIANNAYFNAGYYWNASYNGGTINATGETTWKASVDPTGYYPTRVAGTRGAYDAAPSDQFLGYSVANMFDDTSGQTLELNGVSVVEQTCTNQMFGNVGINGRAYNANYGCYQYGPYTDRPYRPFLH